MLFTGLDVENMKIGRTGPGGY